jgi:hypothetical protein
MTRKKPEVGQVVYMLAVGNAARYGTSKLRAGKVTKVGRKYFTVLEDDKPEHMALQFYLDNWRERTDYSARVVLYESKQDYEDIAEVRRLWELLCGYFQFSSRRHGVSLDVLKVVCDHLEIEK